MFEIETPFGIKGIPLKPELKGRQQVDEKIIQTLSALMGFDGEARRLLTCSKEGSLNSVSPPVAAMENILSVGVGETLTFGDIPTTEVLIRARVFNSDGIWVNIGSPASSGVSWIIMPGEWLKISINNMNQLHFYFVAAGNRIDLIRTV